MHSICITNAFIKAAEAAGMSAEDVDSLTDYLARNPSAGDEIPGTGGCRKLRWRVGNKGKSGGLRTITFYSGQSLPLFLITVFGKGEKANLTKNECNQLAKMTKVLVDEYGTKVVNAGRQS